MSTSLTAADCAALHKPRGWFTRLFQINNGTVNDSLTIDVTAAYNAYVAFDTSLSATAAPFKQNDSCLGVGSDPCLYYQKLPRNGIYYVEVTSADSADTGAFKLRVLHPRQPDLADSLDQRLAADSATPVLPGGVLSQQSIVLRAVLSDPDLGDTLQLQAEVVPSGTGFSGTQTILGGKVPNGSPAYVLWPGLVDNTNYHWRVRAVDQTGRASADWKVFPADPAFNVQAGHDPTLANPNQFQSDGNTAIPVGGVANIPNVVFKAQLSDIDPGSQLTLQVEVKDTGVGFDSVATQQSATVSSGATAQLPIASPILVAGHDYHWQARVVDNTGRHSGWTSFGGNAETAADFHVNQPVSQLGWLTQPGNSTAGSAITGSPRVAAQDPNGNTITTYNGPVTMEISVNRPAGGQVTLLGTTSVLATNGIATFPNLLIDTAATGYKLIARAGTISSVESSPFNVTAAAATQLFFTVQPTSAVAGAVIAPPVKVSAEDQFGNVNTSFANSVTVAIANNSGNPPGTLGGTKSVNAIAGVATFSTLSINKTGLGYTLGASSGSLTPDTSAAFTITAGPATHLSFTVPPNGAASNQVFNPPVQVSGLDANDNVATSFVGNVTVAIGTNPNGGTLNGTLTKPASQGVAMFSDLSIDKVGNGYTLTATTPVPGVAMGTSPAFNITTSVPDPTKSTVQASPLTITACNTGCTAPSTASTITVTARDGGGNPVAGVSATIQVTPGTGNTVVPTTPVTTSASGVATFALNSTKAEVKTITAFVGSVQIAPPASVTVNPGTIASLGFTPGPPGSVTAGTVISPAVAVTGSDLFGNTATGFNGPVTMALTVNPTDTLSGTKVVTATGGVATFSTIRVRKAGTGYTLRASITAPALNATSSAFTVTAAPAVRDTFSVQPTTTVVLARIDSAVGGVVVAITDSIGNIVPTATNSITMTPLSNPGGANLGGTKSRTASGGSATFNDLTLDKLGTGYTLIAQVSGLVSDVSAPFNIVTGPAAKLGIATAPSSSATSGVAFAQQPSIQIQDANGFPVSQSGVLVAATIATNPGGTPSLANATATTNASGTATFSGLAITGLVGSYTLSFGASGLTAVTSGTIALSAGAPTQLVIGVQPSSSAQNGVAFAQQPTVQLRDGSGNAVSQANVTITATIATGPGGGSLTNATALTNASGLATFSGLAITGTAGSYRLRFGSGTLTPDTSTAIALSAGAATQLVIGTQPSASAQNGVAFAQQPAVQLRDGSGNAVSQANVTITATIATGPGGGSLTNATALTNASGLATFSGLAITGTVGSYTLRFGSGSLTPDTSTAIALSAGAATQLVIGTQPSASAQNGVAFAQQPTVQLRDGGGNAVSQANVTITATIATGPGGGSLTNATALTNASGLATFSGLAITGTAGSYTLRFGSGSLTPDTSTAIVLSAGAATQLVIGTQPSSSAQNGVAFAQQPTVQLRDGGGNAVSQANVTITATIATGPGGGSLTNATALTNASGLATFSGLAITGTVGSYTLRFGSGSLTPDTSTAIALSAGAAAKLGITTQPPSSAQSGVAFIPQPVIQIQDASGNPVSQNGTLITATITTKPGGNPSLTSPTATTSASGAATFSGLAITGLTGNYALTFSAATGLTSVTSGTIALSAGGATQLLITTEPSATAQNGVALAPQPAIQLQDAGGNPVSQANVTITATIATGPGGGSLTNATATTNASGLATFSGLAITGTVGSYTLRFGSGSLTPDTSTAIVLSAGAATQLVIGTQPSSSAQNGVAFVQQPTVQLRDGGGNAVSQANVTITATIATGPGGGSLTNATALTNASGLATFSGLAITGTVGSYTLRFGSGSLTPDTSTAIVLSAGAAAKLGITTQPSSSAQSGVAFTTQPVIQVQDANGNPVSQNGTLITATIATNPGGTPSLTNATATTNTSGTATFSGLAIDGLVGSYTLSFSGGGLTPATSSTITLSTGPAAKLAFAVQPPASTVAGVAMSPGVQVVVQDAGGNTVGAPKQTIMVAIGTNPGGGTLSGTQSVQTTGGTGIATFSTLSIDKAAPGYTLVASSGTLTPATSSTFAITAAAAATLSFTTQPQSTTSGSTMSAIVLTAFDAFGNVATGFTGSVTLAITTGTPATGGPGTLNGTTTVSASSGVATFTGLSITDVGTGYTLDATSTLPTVTSAPFDIN